MWIFDVVTWVVLIAWMIASVLLVLARLVIDAGVLLVAVLRWLKQTYCNQVERNRHAVEEDVRALYGAGVWDDIALTPPGAISPETAERIKIAWEEKYSGETRQHGRRIS